jgi:hypothetical protein
MPGTFFKAQSFIIGSSFTVFAPSRPQGDIADSQRVSGIEYKYFIGFIGSKMNDAPIHAGK